MGACVHRGLVAQLDGLVQEVVEARVGRRLDAQRRRQLRADHLPAQARIKTPSSTLQTHLDQHAQLQCMYTYQDVWGMHTL